MIARTYSLLLVRCIISVASLNFLRTRLLSESKHLSITHLNGRAQKNDSCVLGTTMSGSGNFLMAESSF